MGQIQKKYHITDEGKIFEVKEDGSVSEIGNVSSLSITKEVETTKLQPISRKWMWCAIISWIILFIACVVFFIQHDDANSYIYYLQDRNSQLEQQSNQLQSELATKIVVLDSINQQINQDKLKRMPITVTGVQFANENYYSEMIDNYGSSLYSNRVCFLKPKITYTGRKNGSYTLTEKIIRPDGSVLHGDSSPEDATQSFRVNSTSGRNGTQEISSWGWKDPGNYEAGRWTLQIWYDDILVYSTYFDIQ